jgi:hypothetical protein
MIDNLTPQRFANAIMQDKSFKGLYVFVEGEKDRKLYSKFLRKNNLRVKPTFGCYNLFEIFSILNERSFTNKIGIVDRDFHNIVNDKSDLDVNIFMTDYHDLEVMMIHSNAFENMLNVYTHSDEILAFKKAMGRDLSHIIFDLASRIGYLKLANKVHNLGLVFKPKSADGKVIRYNEFISDNLKFKGNKELIKSIINYSRNKSDIKLIEEYILEKYIETSSDSYDLNQLANGHDLSNIIYIFLKKTVKSTNRMLQDCNSIEDSLILAYEFSFFKNTDLYKMLVQWENSNNIKLFEIEN